MAIHPLTERGVDEIVGHLGLSERPPTDEDGLAMLYRAWCRRVPFDNLRKIVARHFDLPEMPGIDPPDFFAAWQLTGAGATCWGSNNALHALLTGLGFDARLRAASMFDTEINHGTTLVKIGEIDWLVDTSVHSDKPLPLVEGQAATVDHEGYVTSVRPDPEGWLIDCPTPDPSVALPCRLHGDLTHAETEAANEKSRDWSPFNDGICAQINDESGSWLLKNSSLARITRTGVVVRELTDTAIDEFLVSTTGHSPALVAEVRAVLEVQAGRGPS